jgi:hypothetical protein
MNRWLRRKISTSAAAWIRPDSALIVPVPAAEEAVAECLGRGSLNAGGLPLHVTVMYPFLRRSAITQREELAVAELARGIEPFGFELARLAEFPGVHYLVPEPSAPFVEIAAAVRRRWPSCAPYGGAYDQVIPHVTVAFGEAPPAGHRELARLLPISAYAVEMWLAEQSRGRWRIRRRFQVGQAAQTLNPGSVDSGGVPG